MEIDGHFHILTSPRVLIKLSVSKESSVIEAQDHYNLLQLQFILDRTTLLLVIAKVL